uniref:histidine kinase n=1 Tax=Ditylum brightwellii TaxID=49249 RepID=A0A6V2LA27_9STRA
MRQSKCSGGSDVNQHSGPSKPSTPSVTPSTTTAAATTAATTEDERNNNNKRHRSNASSDSAVNSSRIMAHELRKLVDTANAPIFGIDINGNVNEWNFKTAEITGYSREEAFHKPLVSTFISPKLQQSVQEVLDMALKGLETSNYELEFETKSKETRYLLVNATTRRDTENKITGVVGVAQDVTEAARHDRAVAAAAHELRQLVDTANAPIFGIDVDGNVNEWNDKTAEITGYSREEAMDKHLVSTFIVPKLRESVQRVMDNALQGKETSNYELEFCTKSKDIRHLLVNATTRRDANYNIMGVVGVAQDVTETAKHDRAVAAMANELRQLVDTANAPIFGIDVDGTVNEWNDKTAEITGFSKEEALKKPLVSTFIVPKLRASVQSVMDNALRGEETSNYELEFRTKSDEIRYLLVNATTRRDAENKIVGVVGVAQDVTEAAKHDRAVAAMANELRQLVDTANAPIFGIDVYGNVNEWNNKTAEITGFTKEEAFNKSLVSTFIVPKLRDSVQAVMDNALRGNETSNYELEFETKSKEIRYLLVNATTRRDPDYNITGVVGVAQDVTESKKHDRAVAAMANELRQLIDTANAPIFGIDVDGFVNEWNEKTAAITGYSREEAMDKPLVTTFIVSKLQKAVQEVMENALRGNETSNYDLEFRTKSGEIRYLLVNATTRRDADSNIVGVVGVAQDVTESSKNDRAVAAMANELRQLVDTANAPIFGIDVDGNVNEWNEKTAEITGYSKEEAFNKPLVSTFIVPKLRESVQGVLDNALQGNETSNYELEFETKVNEIRYLLVNATTRRDPDGNIVGVVGVAQDVTESSKNDRAVAAMAHELRQLVDTANAPIFGIDVNGKVNEWNNKTAEITGFSKEEAFDKPLTSTFIVPSLRKSVQEVLDKALHGIETSNYELEFETKSKEIRYLLVNATTRRDAENSIIGVVGVAQDVTESTKNDRAMSAMARELRQLVDTANAPIFGIDVEGDVNEWNDKTAEITGFSKEEAFDYPLVETFIVPSLRQSVQEVLDNALKGIETSNYELEFRTKSNEVRYLLVNATTRRDAENNIVGVVGVAQDVTEAAQHDRAVAAMANELRQLVDTANAPIFGIDVHGNVNEWNNKTAEITGFTKEEAFDKPLVSTFIVSSLRQSVQEVMDNALQGRETSNYELEFRTKSGEIRYLLVNATTRRDADSNIVGVVGVAQDVTEAAQHDRAVAAMANELRQLVDTANAPIFGIDVYGNVNEWNDKTAEITGFTKEEAFNKPLVTTFIVASLRQSVQEVLDNALKGKETSNYELEFRTKTNEVRYLLVNATTRRDAENNIVGVVGVAQDVTEAAKHDRAVAA